MPRRRRSTRAATPARSEGYLPHAELEQRRREQDLRDARYVFRQLQDPFVQWRIREAARHHSRRFNVVVRQPATGRRVRAHVDLTTGEIINPETWFDRDQAVRDVINQDCRRAKEDRRGSILSSGHGGRNNATNYRRHDKC